MNSRLLVIFILICSSVCLGQPSRSYFNISDFGAKGDGVALDSPAINRAIDAAAASGGGTVYFPAGTYRSFSIRLKSNITLEFGPGSVLLAASPKDGDGRYDEPEPNRWDSYQDFGHSHWHNSLIWGDGVENVSIVGPGLIWGKGLIRSGSSLLTDEENERWRKGLVQRPKTLFGLPNARDTVPNGYDNKAIALKLSRNVTIRDVFIRQGGHFAILATGVDNLTVDNVKIDTNRDGINVDSCRNVRLSNLSVNLPYDDGIVLKSSYARGYPRATENVMITNSHISGYHLGTMLNGKYLRELPNDKREFRSEFGGYIPTGRIKFGTESKGGFRSITISNCTFDFSSGLALESVDGGVLEDVTISNITMRDIKDSPIFIRLGSRGRGPDDHPKVGAIRRIKISNIIVHNADSRFGSIIAGIPTHPIEDLELDNIRINYVGGGTAEQAKLIVPENEKGYPEPEMFCHAMPSSAFFIRHARSISLSNIQITYDKPDARPAIILHAVHYAEIDRLRVSPLPSLGMFGNGRISNVWLMGNCCPNSRLTGSVGLLNK